MGSLYYGSSVQAGGPRKLPTPACRARREWGGHYEVDGMDKEVSNSEVFKWFVVAFLVFVVAIVWFIPGQLIVALGLVMMIEGSALWLLPIFLSPKPAKDEWS